jgi:hypothetical protein
VHAVSGAIGALTSGAIVDRVGVRASLLLMNASWWRGTDPADRRA